MSGYDRFSVSPPLLQRFRDPRGNQHEAAAVFQLP
jgi:hypothetical protein